MTRTRNFRAFVALKQIKLPKINQVLDSSKATAAMTHLLSEIAEDLLNADESGPAAEKQLADFINNLWSKKLPDSNLKDKSAKYLRPANSETLATPWFNLEIWDKLSHPVKQQDLSSRQLNPENGLGTASAVLCKSIEMLLEMKNSEQAKSDSDIQKLPKSSTDAVALLGYAHVDLSHHRMESIKPHLNKDYAGLCASHVPVTALLFGNDVQTQLNNIPASNRVSTTAVASRHKNVKGHPLRNYQKSDRRSKSFFYRKVVSGTGSHPKNRSSDRRTRGRSSSDFR